MKARGFMIVLIAFVLNFSGAILSQQTAVKHKDVRKIFPHFSLAIEGGSIFPLSKGIREEFKPGGLAGVDLCIRVNREVGFYGNFNYIFMGSKKTGAPIGNYLEFTAGPRYYFTHPKLSSTLFFEAGVGAYDFLQKGYVSPSDTTGTVIPKIANTRAGLSGGIGASIMLSESFDLIAKAKYHNIFTPTGSEGFMTVNAGFELRFR